LDASLAGYQNHLSPLLQADEKPLLAYY